MEHRILTGCYAGYTIEHIMVEDPAYIGKCIQIALLVDGLRPIASSLPVLAPSIPTVPVANLLATPAATPAATSAVTAPSPSSRYASSAAQDLAGVNFVPTASINMGLVPTPVHTVAHQQALFHAPAQSTNYRH